MCHCRRGRRRSTSTRKPVRYEEDTKGWKEQKKKRKGWQIKSRMSELPETINQMINPPIALTVSVLYFSLVSFAPRQPIENTRSSVSRKHGRCVFHVVKSSKNCVRDLCDGIQYWKLYVTQRSRVISIENIHHHPEKDVRLKLVLCSKEK